MAAVLTNRRRVIAIVLAAFGLGVAVGSNVLVEQHAVPPVPLNNLGLAVDHAEQAAPIVAQMPTFFVVGAEGEDNRKKNIRLWDWVKIATGGKHVRNFAQETGDCVSQGTRNAAEYFNGAAIGKGLLQSEYHEVFPPYTYGGSRVTIGKGKLGRSPGSVGAWAAEFTQRFGVLRADGEGVPPYSGKVADEWGYKGPPAQFVEAAKMFTFETVAPVKSARDVRDAICNGYPVTIASDFGTRTIRPKDGRQVAIRNTKWYHQMCIVAYDGSTNAGPWYYVVNSWGENAHPAPLQDEPPGGFWISEADCEYIVRQNDSYAYSGFAGFPAQEFQPDFSVIGAAGPQPQQDQENVMQPLAFAIPQEWQAPGTGLGLALIIAAVVVWMWRTKGNGFSRIAGAVAMIAAVASANAAAAQEIDFHQLTAAASGPQNARGGTSHLSDPDFAVLTESAALPISAELVLPEIDFTALTVAAIPVEVVPPPPMLVVPDVPASAAASPPPKYPTRGALWSHPGVHTREQLITHLMSGQHAGKFTRKFLETQSMASLEALHSDDHEGKAMATFSRIMEPKQAAKPQANGRWVQMKVCRNGVCTIESVWVTN